MCCGLLFRFRIRYREKKIPRDSTVRRTVKTTEKYTYLKVNTLTSVYIRKLNRANVRRSAAPSLESNRRH
jgi:hypothetical protein